MHAIITNKKTDRVKNIIEVTQLDQDIERKIHIKVERLIAHQTKHHLSV